MAALLLRGSLLAALLLRGSLLAALLLCFVLPATTTAWGLNSGPEEDRRSSLLGGQTSLVPGEASRGEPGALVELFGLSRGGSPVAARGLMGLSLGRGGGLEGNALFGGRPRSRALDDGASSYQLGFTTPSFQLTSSFRDVGARFSPSESAGDGTSSDEMEALRGAFGTRTMNLNAALNLAPGIDLTSTHNSVRNDRPEDEHRGLTTTDTVHSLAFNLGVGGRLTTSLNEHREEWDRTRGLADRQRRTNAIEYTSQFGGGGRHGLRFAMTTVEKSVGEQEESERTREAHLNLAPTGRLQLTADYVANTSDSGQDKKTRTVGAVMQLAPNTELAASCNTEVSESSGRSRGTTMRLTTNWGGGSSAGRLTAEENAVDAEESGADRNRNWSLTAGLGEGTGRTNLRATLREKRGEGPTGRLQRAAALHLDRSFGPRLQLTVDRAQTVRGTNEEFDLTMLSTCALAADLGGQTSLTAELRSEQDNEGGSECMRDVSLRREVGRLALAVSHRAWSEGPHPGSGLRYAIDYSTGEVPEWANEMSQGHVFEEAEDYLVPEAPDWVEMDFLGFRFWTDDRRGGPDAGLRTFAFAHRAVVANRYHLQLAYQECPEDSEESRRGRPMELRRQLVELGAPVSRNLRARARYLSDASTIDPRSHEQTVTLGLLGRLADEESLEASVSCTAGRWDEESRDRASVSLLYSCRLDEERRMSLRMGYSWGEDEPGAQEREGRLDLSYHKPI